MSIEQRLAKLEKDVQDLKDGQAAIYNLIKSMQETLSHEIRQGNYGVKNEVRRRAS